MYFFVSTFSLKFSTCIFPHDGCVVLQDFRRYLIKGFEALNPAAFEDACGILLNGTVLIENF